MALATRFTEMFGCRHPLQQAGMGGVASPDLALAVSAAGGIGTGQAMAAAITAGADAVRVGTRFVAADETRAHPGYVEALIGADADDTC
jgi:NAD(P)H-dependent flavin oxidoreductase YrpB (nitropropane dioxygenase family)